MKRARQRLAALLALVLTLFLPGCQEGEMEEEEVGYFGPAHYNPFLAAQRFLGEMGCAVEPTGTLQELPRSSGTVIASLDSFANYGDATRVVDWVQRGGHLVLLLSGAEPWRDDWAYASSKAGDEEKPDEEQQTLLDKLGIKEVDLSAESEVTVHSGAHRYRADLAGGIKLEKKPARQDVDGADAVMSWNRGFGRVTAVSAAHPFRNRYLAQKDHAALLFALVSLDHRSVVSFVSTLKVSFWKMLWQQGWPAIVCLAAVLVLWLWKNLPRFGPILVAEDHSSRDFTGHLAMAGAFLWRNREVAALLVPLQQDVRAALTRRGLVAEDPATQDELATRTGLTADRVRLALFLVAPSAESVFLRTVQDLHTLRSKI